VIRLSRPAAGRLLTLLVTLALWAPAGVRAAPTDDPDDIHRPLGFDPAEAEPERYRDWDRPAPDVQVEMDGTLLPVGRGGILVPGMSDPRLGPRYLVQDGEGRGVGDQETGRVLVVPPGAYTVLVGSGSLEDRMRLPVQVHEGRVALVKPAWSGLRVSVVTDRSVPFRGTYELLGLPARTRMGVGFGAKVELGERVDTWLLEPGTYMLLKPGETYQARRDFFTLRVRAGHLERYTLVMDEETGDFLGAGEVQMSEGASRIRDFFVSMVGGGGILFSNRDNVAGRTPGNSFSFDLFFDAILRYIPDPHHFYTRLRIEESQTKQPNTPFQVSFDEVSLDAIYIYKVLPWLGPYARGGVDTKLFPGVRYYDNPVTVGIGHWVPGPAGGPPVWTPQSSTPGVSDYRLSNRFFPLVLDGGTGLNLDISVSYYLDLTTRLGVGVRQTWFDGLLQDVTSPAAGVYAFERVEDRFVKGFEGALILSARLTRWVLASAELEVIDPFDDLRSPVVDLYTNVGLRLSSFASLNYVVDLLFDRNVSDAPQIDQRLILRFSYKFL